MAMTATHRKPHFRRPLQPSPSRSSMHPPSETETQNAPIVAAVDRSRSATRSVDAAIDIAREFGAPLVFVYVRRGPSSTLGEPYYQRRLDGEMRTGKRALDDALARAERAGVPASGEQLAGDPARRIVEFARHRDARLVVLGSRRRRLGRSVSRRVIRSADRPVVVGGRAAPVAA